LPAHVAIHIADAELQARGLDRFSRDHPSILKSAVLPGLDGRTLWPPPRSEADVAMFAAPTYDPRYSPEWGLHRDQQNAEAEAKAIAAEKERAEAAERMAAELKPRKCGLLNADRQNRRPRGRPENVAFASASPGRVRGFRFRTFGLKFEFGLRQEP
jgi:hypothetical protein